MLTIGESMLRHSLPSDVATDPTIPRKAIEHAERFLELCQTHGLRQPDEIGKGASGGVSLWWRGDGREYDVELTDQWGAASCGFDHGADGPVTGFDPREEVGCVANIEWIREGLK